MTSTSEYLPDESEAVTVPGAGNGRPTIQTRVFQMLLRDHRIPHGAFRLWHLLFDMSRSGGFCWPGVRFICAALHAKDQSVSKWRKLLVQCGYLDAEPITKANAPASKKLGGFLFRIKDPSRKGGHQEADTLWQTPNSGRYSVDAPERTRKGCQQKGDVTDQYTNRSSPRTPPQGDDNSSLRSTEHEEEKMAGNEKPLVRRLTAKLAWQRLDRIKEEIQKLKADEKSYGRRLSDNAREGIAWCEQQASDCEGRDAKKAASYREEAERRRVNPASYRRGDILPAVADAIRALVAEREKLHAWLDAAAKNARL